MVRSFLLLAVLVASLVTSALVHAREIPGDHVLIECSGYSEQDDSRTPADPAGSDKAIAQHHGNCHSAAAYVPAQALGSDEPMAQALRPIAHAPDTLGRWSPGPDLRPPIA
jgi:hypothetical protein